MEYPSLAVKIFSETVCVDCSSKNSGIEEKPQYESTLIYLKDNMGRDIFWD